MNFLNLQGEGYIATCTRSDLTDSLHNVSEFKTDFQIVNNQTTINIFKSHKIKKFSHFFKKEKKLGKPYSKGFRDFYSSHLSKMKFFTILLSCIHNFYSLLKQT